jgi:hypothetical protein
MANINPDMSASIPTGSASAVPDVERVSRDIRPKPGLMNLASTDNSSG